MSPVVAPWAYGCWADTEDRSLTELLHEAMGNLRSFLGEGDRRHISSRHGLRDRGHRTWGTSARGLRVRTTLSSTPLP